MFTTQTGGESLPVVKVNTPSPPGATQSVTVRAAKLTRWDCLALVVKYIVLPVGSALGFLDRNNKRSVAGEITILALGGISLIITLGVDVGSMNCNSNPIRSIVRKIKPFQLFFLLTFSLGLFVKSFMEWQQKGLNGVVAGRGVGSIMMLAICLRDGKPYLEALKACLYRCACRFREGAGQNPTQGSELPPRTR